jgi:hypothetical protein
MAEDSRFTVYRAKQRIPLRLLAVGIALVGAATIGIAIGHDRRLIPVLDPPSRSACWYG